MAAKPKKSDYEASESEKINAKVAVAERQYFVEKYDPLILEQAEAAMNENLGGYVSGRKSADVNQALTKPSLAAAQSVDAAATLASAASSEIAAGYAGAEQAQKNRALSSLGSARGQQMDATTGLGALARLKNSETLQSAQRKMERREANVSAGMQLAGAVYQQGKQNIDDGFGFFGGEKYDKNTGMRTSPAQDRTKGALGRFTTSLFG